MVRAMCIVLARTTDPDHFLVSGGPTHRNQLPDAYAVVCDQALSQL